MGKGPGLSGRPVYHRHEFSSMTLVQLRGNVNWHRLLCNVGKPLTFHIFQAQPPTLQCAIPDHILSFTLVFSCDRMILVRESGKRNMPRQSHRGWFRQTVEWQFRPETLNKDFLGLTQCIATDNANNFDEKSDVMLSTTFHRYHRQCQPGRDDHISATHCTNQSAPIWAPFDHLYPMEQCDHVTVGQRPVAPLLAINHKSICDSDPGIVRTQTRRNSSRSHQSQPAIRHQPNLSHVIVPPEVLLPVSRKWMAFNLRPSSSSSSHAHVLQSCQDSRQPNHQPDRTTNRSARRRRGELISNESSDRRDEHIRQCMMTRRQTSKCEMRRCETSGCGLRHPNFPGTM
jgi:hypothetical protein